MRGSGLRRPSLLDSTNDVEELAQHVRLGAAAALVRPVVGERRHLRAPRRGSRGSPRACAGAARTARCAPSSWPPRARGPPLRHSASKACSKARRESSPRSSRDHAPARARIDDDAVHEAGRDAELALVGGDGVQRRVEHHATEVEDDGPEGHERRGRRYASLRGTCWWTSRNAVARLSELRTACRCSAAMRRVPMRSRGRPMRPAAPDVCARSAPASGPRSGARATSSRRFEARPLLGAVLVDAQPDRAHRGQPRLRRARRDHAQLGALVRGVAKQVLGDDAIVVAGETGRLEVIVLTFREGRDGALLSRRPAEPGARASTTRSRSAATALVYPYAQEGARARRRLRRAGAQPVPRRRHADPRRDRGRARGRRAEAQDRVRAQRHACLMSVLLAGASARSTSRSSTSRRKTVFGYEALARGPAGTELHSPARAVRGRRGAPPRVRARLPVPAERPRRRDRPARRHAPVPERAAHRDPRPALPARRR